MQLSDDIFILFQILTKYFLHVSGNVNALCFILASKCRLIIKYYCTPDSTDLME